jgi:hypothetical protein
MPAEQLHFFASLDFPDRTTVQLREIAKRLGCSVKHLLNEVDSGALVGIDIKAARVSRRAMRIPVECYRAYILHRLTGPVDFKMQFLHDLPAATRRQLLVELQASLKSNP